MLGDAQDPQSPALQQGTLSGKEVDPEASPGLQRLPHGNDGPDPPPDLQTQLRNRPGCSDAGAATAS